jgi:hypothetical protein
MNREGTMNKLRMLVLTALAATTIGTGALAAAPSASAKPDTDNCVHWLNSYRNSMLVAGNRVAEGDWASAARWLKRANDAARLISANC